MNNIKRTTVAALGCFVVGLGVAFNQRAKLGNDPVGVFFDGMRTLFHLNNDQLGTVTFAVNLTLICLLLFIGRKYVSIGTVIYFVFYGLSIQFGGRMYDLFIPGQILWIQIVMSVIGCLSIYLGVALFIVADIGLDPMTALASVLSDRLKWPFGRAKILFDATMLAVGFLMGGKVGVITVITAITSGPVIQKLVSVIKINKE